MFFFNDLYRELDDETIEIDFVQTSSYNQDAKSSGKVSLKIGHKDLEVDLAGKDVVIVDEVIETGRSLWVVVEDIKQAKPRRVLTCVLIDKGSRVREQASVENSLKQPDVSGLHLNTEEWLVGYGMAKGDIFRHLPEIYTLKIM